MEPLIGVVLLNWNGREETLACLASFRKVKYRNFTIYVVDNASTDGSADAIRERYPEVEVIRNRVNVGFDGGNNIGITAALRDGAEAVFLLNNDTVVCPEILGKFVDAAAGLPRAGVLGPKIFYYDRPEILWWAGCRKTYSATGWLLNYTQEGKGKPDRGQYDEIARIDAVIGCAMYIRRAVFEEIGLLDERFFIYHEEYDFCRRAAAAGWGSYFIPGAKVWHKISQSMGGQYSPSLYYLWTRNWLLVSRKHTRFILWPLLYLAYVKESLWVYQGLMEKGKTDAAEAALAGAWNAVLNRFGPPRRITPPAWIGRVVSWRYGARLRGRE